MSHRVYFIGIGASAAQMESSVKLVDVILDPLGDWVRLNHRTWFCSTDCSSEQLYQEIHERMPWLERIVIVALDPTDRFGLAPEWVWAWIDGQRKSPAKTARAIISETLSNSRTGPETASKVAEAAEG